MNLKKGDRVLCVENNSTVRPLVIESIGDKILFSKQLDKGIKKTFGLKKGSFQLIKPRYISEHEKKEYINPELERHDRVKIIHVHGSDENNLLGRNATVIGIKENSRGDREVWLWVDGLSSNADSKTPNPVPYILTLEQGTMETNYPHESIPGDRIQKSLVYKLDEPKGKQEDYIEDLLHLPEHTEEKKQEVSPELEVGDRIMAWDIPGGNPLYIDIDGTQVSADIDKSAPSTFIATVIDVLDTYNPAYGNGIKYLVKIEDTDEVIGLYGGEWLGGTKYPIRDKYHKDTRDKWLKLPKIGITEDSDIFGQGLLDPIEPEEFEGEDEEWDELVGGVEDDKFVVEPEYDYEGGKTNPEVGFVAPSAEVTDNICKAKGFCEAQGPITFGQLKALVEEATKKRISGDIGRGVFKTLWRIIPFFIPQVLLAAVGVTVTRAFNKIITPSLKNTRGYKNWWGKVVLKAMDVAEGDYIPDVALGDDPLSKIFFISDGLLQMIRDKYKLKFARYVADYASSRPDNEPVPEWFVENLLRDYLNQKFLLDPPLEPKEGTDFQMIREHDEEGDPEDGIQTREPFTRTEAQILNYLAKEFTWEELNTISSVDETQIYGDLDKKWDNTLKLFGQAPKGDDESWIRSSRWAKWAVENWEEAKVEMDGGGYSQDFKKVTNPIKSWPSWFEVDANESYWQKEYRSGTIELGAYDRDDAEERANLSWWDYDPDMEHYDYGDTDDHELDTSDVRYMKTLNEHEQPQEKEAIDTVQDIVDSVYPHIVNNLGKSMYVDETPKVELHRDIYERLSGIEGMEGEESKTSKSEYESHVNTIYIYYPNMETEKDVIQSLLHEYTHSLQDPKKRKKHREEGYENNPYEQQSSDAEDNWEDYLIYLQENISEGAQETNPKLINKFLKDFWPQHRSQLYRDLYNTYHPSTYLESFNRPSTYFEDSLETLADAVHEGKKLGLLDSSVDWSDIVHYDENDYSTSDTRVLDDNGIPTLNNKLEILDNTNLDWVHAILLFDVLEEIVDEFKHYCGENGIDESGMGKCMDEFPPSPVEGTNKPENSGTLKQDYYTLFNFMRELERAGVPVTDYLKDPTYPNIIKLVDDGTSDYNEEGGVRGDFERIYEHKENLNPSLNIGDKIVLIDEDSQEGTGIKVSRQFRPELFIPYIIVEKTNLYSAESGGKRVERFQYKLLTVDDYDSKSEEKFSELSVAKKIFYPWLYKWIPVDKKTISEHKESKKLNPELMVGDEILVVATEGIHDFGIPELFKPYVVVGLKHGTAIMKGGKELEDYPYYQIEPVGMTDEERTGAMLAGGGRMKPLYLYPKGSSSTGGKWDQWILNPGFLRGEHLTEEKESGGVWDYIFGDSIAVGLTVQAGEKYSKEMSTKLGWSREGAWPEKILGKIREFIKDKDLINKNVLLSSGYSNVRPTNGVVPLGPIESQITALNNAGANVHLLGVSNTLKLFRTTLKVDPNEELSNLGGTTFLGGFKASDDNVHPPGYSSLYSSISSLGGSLNEQAGGRNMKGFTPKLIGYLKFLFETTEISDDYIFVRETTNLFNIGEWQAQALYLILMYNSNHTGRKEMLEMLNNMPIEDYVIPSVWEYEISYYGEYERIDEEEECSGDGFGETSGEECYCEEGVKYVQDEDGDEVEEECDFEQDDDCECIEFERKSYEIYYNNICTKIIYSTTKLEKTHEGSDEAYGYEEMYEIDSELNDSNSLIEHEDCDLEYDDGNTWDYFHERDDEIIGMDTDKWSDHIIPNLLEKINNKIYGIKPLIDIIEDQYDVMSDRDTKMKDLTSQIFDILDDNFDMFEHPEGEIEYDGKNMGLYSHHNDSFVPFEHVYNPIIQMLEGGIQQEDIEVFVEIITNWVNYVMSEKREYLNEEVNIKSEDSNYSKEDYEKFVDFAHKELNIEKDCPIDVEAEKSTEYTTGNYHIQDKKIKVLDNGRKLADILRTIAHELVHHKQNELGQLVGDIPEIGGTIEDQANAYAGRLVKKYGKQTKDLYTK